MGNIKSVKFIQHNAGLVSFKVGKTIHILTDKAGIPKFYGTHDKAMQAVSRARVQVLEAQGPDLMAALIGDVLVDFRVHYVQGFDQLAASQQIRFGQYVRIGTLTGVKVEGPAALTWHTTGLEARPIPKGPKRIRRSIPGSRRKSAALL